MNIHVQSHIIQCCFLAKILRDMAHLNDGFIFLHIHTKVWVAKVHISAVFTYVKRPVNTVFQKYALFPHLNVYDNIAFGLKLKKTPNINRRTDLLNLSLTHYDDSITQSQCFLLIVSYIYKCNTQRFMHFLLGRR